MARSTWPIIVVPVIRAAIVPNAIASQWPDEAAWCA